MLGKTASFRFYAAAEGTAVLELQGMSVSLPNGTPQVFFLELNGQLVNQTVMVPQWKNYEIQLFSKYMQLGWNEITLRFQHTVRPKDINPKSRDRRRLSARFRYLRIHSPLNRPLWRERPALIDLDSTATAMSTEVRIEMPTDSLLEVYIEPTAGAALVGSVDVEVATDPTNTEIWAAVELLDNSAKQYNLFKQLYTSEPRRHTSLDMDLSQWAGQHVQIRLRSWGRSNGIVRWTGLGITRPSDPAVTKIVQPGYLLAPPNSARLERPDILFILLDAARADTFNEKEISTPHVDSLASKGTRFKRAWSPSPWTGQTIPSLLTGLNPEAFGAITWGSRIPESLQTLPELLSEAGYFTVVWSQHSIYRGNRSLRRGFERFFEVRSNVLSDRNILPEPEDLFTDSQPTFALIHLLPPHGPYNPPLPFSGALTSWYTGDALVNAKALNRISRIQSEVTNDDLRYIRGRYNENSLFADALVGRLLQTFRGASRYENSLIVILADHGEGFLEHGRFLHTSLVYDEFIRVPLVIKWPAHVTKFTPVITQAVSLLDLVPTLVDGLGLLSERTLFQGRSLLPLVLDQVSVNRDVYAHTRGVASINKRARPVSTLQSNHHKIIYNGTSETIEVYDMKSDPEEQFNLVLTEPYLTRFLLGKLMLQQHRNSLIAAELGGQEAESLDAETLRRLRALGYVQ